ncbi:MAG: cache domain-containing protein, partial [Deltaproteobacteria bacterium]|nr:cache domain-containing protein [Deltaproteobacteria bacterium]
MKRDFFKSGREFSLALTVAAIVGSVALIGILAYSQMYEQRRVMSLRGNSYISDQISSAMSLWLNDQVRIAEMLAGSPEVLAYCKSPLDVDKRAAAQNFLEGSHALLPYFTLINVIYYLQDGEDAFSLAVNGEKRLIRDGHSLVDSIGGKSVGVGGASFSYLTAVAQGSAAFISEAKPNALPGLPPVYVVAVPVKDGDGRLLAALSFGVKLEYFNRQFVVNFHQGETGRIEIIDNRGFFVGAPEQGKELAAAFQAEGEGILRHLSPHKGTTFFMDLPGGRYDYAASPVWIPYDTASTWWILVRRSG